MASYLTQNLCKGLNKLLFYMSSPNKSSMRKQLVLMAIITLMGITSYGQELTSKVAWSIKYGHSENLKQFITQEHIDACVGVADSKKYGYLAISIKLKSMESLRYFVENGADIEGVCSDKTPLMYAAKYGQLEMLQYLVAQGANLNATYKGRTALGFARQFRRRAIVRYLREL